MWHIVSVAKVKIVATDLGIYVRNWIVSYWVPWGAIKELDVASGLVIVLTDDSVLKPRVGEGSLASAIRGNRSQRAIRERIEQVRQESVEVPA